MSYLWAKYEGSHFLDHVPPLTRSRKKGALKVLLWSVLELFNSSVFLINDPVLSKKISSIDQPVRACTADFPETTNHTTTTYLLNIAFHCITVKNAESNIVKKLLKNKIWVIINQGFARNEKDSKMTTLKSNGFEQTVLIFQCLQLYTLIKYKTYRWRKIFSFHWSEKKNR